MAQYSYKARTPDGQETTGIIEAASMDLAVSSLQRRNLLIVAVDPIKESAVQSIFNYSFGRIRKDDVVLLTRQLATLFEAKVAVVEALKILSGEAQSKLLRQHLSGLLDDIQGGIPMSQAMSKHPEVFSKFYVAMVKSGEESGKLEEIFKFLADYLERTLALTQKARNALIYPGFVLTVFIGVMIFMLVYVFPNITAILTETGQALPIYTVIVIGLSDFLRNFGVIILVFLAIFAIIIYRYSRTENGQLYFARITISVPIIGNLYKKIYLSRIADNLFTLLSGGITIVRALEITAEVVGNEIYKRIVTDAITSVKGGSMISDAFAKYEDIPQIFSQMVRVGEATGRLDYLLKSLANFYRREVDNLVENLVTLIEPILIVALGGGVAILVFSVLMPIYNLANAF